MRLLLKNSNQLQLSQLCVTAIFVGCLQLIQHLRWLMAQCWSGVQEIVGSVPVWDSQCFLETVLRLAREPFTYNLYNQINK